MNNVAKSNIILATQNQGKVREFKRMLSMMQVEVKSLADFTNILEVEEAGKTFKENAILKATGYAVQTGHTTIADDSGLEVEALGGAPGVYSARYGGDQATDQDRVTKLLLEMSNSGDANRRARFVCVIAVYDQVSRSVVTFDGICKGRIDFEPSGDNGFGYDPIFIPDGHSESFAKLPVNIKDEISHRSNAVRAATAYIRKLIGSVA